MENILITYDYNNWIESSFGIAYQGYIALNNTKLLDGNIIIN